MSLTLLLLMIAPDEVEFVADISQRYDKEFKQFLFTGKLDLHGNFVPDPKTVPIDCSKNELIVSRTGGRSLMFEMMRTKRTNDLYEFRSNRLIQGGINVRSIHFEPDVGSTILDFSNYKYSSEARPIYNLPGKFVPKKDLKKPESPALPATKPPAPNTVKKQNDPKSASTDQIYDFELDLSVEYSRHFGDWLYFGKLDQYGEFVFSGTKMPINVVTGPKYYAGSDVPLMSHVKQKEVYEFRSKTLIPGVIEKGEFIPELGGKIIDFEEYKYAKDARPIYNLPGKFVPREKWK